MAITHIYSLNCPITGDVKYIGKSDNIQNRYIQHIKDSKHKKCYNARWIKSLLNKSLKPNLELIDNVSVGEWQFWERHYISLYKSWGFKLTNLTNGGDGGAMLPHIAIQSGIKRRGIPSHRKGCKHTEFSKNKNRIAHIGKMTGEKHPRSKKILQFDINNNLINEFISITDASKHIGVSHRTAINNCLKGMSKTSMGFKWKYK